MRRRKDRGGRKAALGCGIVRNDREKDHKGEQSVLSWLAAQWSKIG